MGLAAWAQARRRLPFGDRLVRHPQCQATAAPKAGFIRSPIPDLEFHLPEMMPAVGVVLVRHQKETRSVASRTAFYRVLPPERQDPSRIRATTPMETSCWPAAVSIAWP